MKKMFLFAAAAMVSLSSCVQTSEVYTGKLQEMGFKSAVTRAIIQSNDDMTYPIAVTAVWDDAKDGTFTSYFENGKFVTMQVLSCGRVSLLATGQPAVICSSLLLALIQ